MQVDISILICCTQKCRNLQKKLIRQTEEQALLLVFFCCRVALMNEIMMRSERRMEALKGLCTVAIFVIWRPLSPGLAGSGWWFESRGFLATISLNVASIVGEATKPRSFAGHFGLS